MRNPPESTVVIAGAGYAGLAAAKVLARHAGIRVILINQNDYHLLQFQLHEAAVNKIDTQALALPMSSLLPRNVEFVRAKMSGFDFKARVVHTDQGDFTYDRLIIALGSQPATYNIPGLNEHALMLKSLSHARILRGHLEMTLSALKSRTPSRSAPYPIVIGGAGITGVELAAELGEGLQELTRAYDLDRDTIRVILLEAAATVLPGFDRKTIEEATRALQHLGIEIRTHTAIERVEADRIYVKPAGSDRPEIIETQTLIWTGGVRANTLVLNSGLTLGERGAVVVDGYLRSSDYPDVSIIGDSAVVRDPRDGHVAIPSGQLAVQQGKYAARQIIADLQGDVVPPHVPHMDGLLISLGSYAGVGTLGPIWVRRLFARLLKIGAETRYLFNIGGVKLALVRGLLLRHEFVMVERWLRRSRSCPKVALRRGQGTKGQGNAVA